MGVIIPRTAWGARPVHGSYTPRGLDEVTDCFIHYSDTHESIPPPSVASDAGTVRAIQAYHLSRGYVDIAYEALVGPSGDIFVGRPNDAFDAGTCNNNRNGYSICVLTDYWITPAQAGAVKFCVGLGRAKFPNLGRVPKPHSQACATACPGDAVRAWIGSTSW